jgi:lysophospholipase L1-like esterase
VIDAASPQIVVTVVRGHADEDRLVFEKGKPPCRTSVGSSGDWVISGPGVLPLHLWLKFDGERLFAARGEAAVLLRGTELGEEWTVVEDEEELRFGFARLRIDHEVEPAAAAPPVRVRRRMSVAAAATCASAVVAGVLLLKGSTGARAHPPVAPSPSASSAFLPAPSPSPSFTAAPEVAPAARALAEGLQAPESTNLRRSYRQNIANRPIPRIGEKPWLVSEEWRAHHEQQLRAPGRAAAQVIFLGDSITEAWGYVPAYREHFGAYSPFNLGIANDSTQNVLWRLEHGALDGTHARAIVVMIGVNNLAGGFTAEQTADGVRAIVTLIRTRAPTTRVLLLGILPARPDADHPLRQAIKETNRLLLGGAEPGWVDVRDVGAVMLEPNGSIAKTTMRDFLHPTALGFERLSEATAPYLQALVNAAAQ